MYAKESQTSRSIGQGRRSVPTIKVNHYGETRHQKVKSLKKSMLLYQERADRAKLVEAQQQVDGISIGTGHVTAASALKDVQANHVRF